MKGEAGRVKSTAEKFAGLKPFLPEGGFEQVIGYFEQYPVFLKITRERKTILGNYRNPIPGHPVHRISINGSLNPYSFLITLLHELAHMHTFIEYGRKATPHGVEWQRHYRQMLGEALRRGIFPKPLEQPVKDSLQRVKAATCSDPDLYRALKAYDRRPAHLTFVEEIPKGAYFRTEDGRKFQMLGKARTRYHCKEVATDRVYYFNALAEVSLQAV